MPSELTDSPSFRRSNSVDTAILGGMFRIEAEVDYVFLLTEAKLELDNESAFASLSVSLARAARSSAVVPFPRTALSLIAFGEALVSTILAARCSPCAHERPRRTSSAMIDCSKRLVAYQRSYPKGERERKKSKCP